MNPTPQPPDPVDQVALRRRRAAIAGHRGDSATARSLLNDDDPTVRATALGAVARTGSLTSADLTDAVADPDPGVRRRAAELVAQLVGGSVAAEVPLLPLLSDPDPTVVEAAVWALGEREVPEVGSVAALAALATGAEDALVREAAVAALGSLGDEAGLPAILAATHDKATVRRRAVIALAPFEGPEVDEAYQRALTDRDWQVRQAAEDLTSDGAPPFDPE